MSKERKKGRKKDRKKKFKLSLGNFLLFWKKKLISFIFVIFYSKKLNEFIYTNDLAVICKMVFRVVSIKYFRIYLYKVTCS